MLMSTEKAIDIIKNLIGMIDMSNADVDEALQTAIDALEHKKHHEDDLK